MSLPLSKIESTLTPQERLFVDNVVMSGSVEEGWVAAGYLFGKPNWKSNAATLARKPAILAAIHVAVGRQLQVDAVAARRVARQLMDDPEVSEKVRADLAIKLMRVGGHVEPKQEQRDTTGDKSLAELSMQELRERAEALERELAERARPVISANVVPDGAQVIDIIDVP